MRARRTAAGIAALLLAAPPAAPSFAQSAASSGAGAPIIAWTYEVQPGDTFRMIAQRMGVTMEALGQVNGIPSPYVIRVGQVLKRPDPVPAATLPGAATPDAPAVASTYAVQPGDTFQNIARRMGVTMEALGQANGIPSPYIIRVGQVLRRPAAVETPRPAPAPRPAPTPRPAPAVRPAPAPHVREAGAPVLAWPVSGAVLSRFGTPVPSGSVASGQRNRGIDLAAYAGLTVRAAAGGTVIFAGNEPERFGQLIIIDHGQGWATAYAYLGKVRVKEGEVVKARQAIASIGKSGEAKRPTLHFELRRDNDPRDPVVYLPVRL